MRAVLSFFEGGVGVILRQRTSHFSVSALTDGFLCFEKSAMSSITSLIETCGDGQT